MREQPQGKALLAIARQVLKESILPNLPAEQRYNALMIANAMAIAARQYDSQNVLREKEVLQSLMASVSPDRSPATQNASPESLIKTDLARLIVMIRQGQFDVDAPAALKDYLSLQVLQRVRESNPKALPS